MEILFSYDSKLMQTLTFVGDLIILNLLYLLCCVPVFTIGAAQAVLETEAVREMVKNYVAAEDDIAVELPDYENLPRPLIEVFTLDSATCAACTYMMGAANVAKDTFGDAIDMVEYKFTLKENIARCKKMGVKNLPSIYINGKLKFSSIIPSKEELEAAVREVL